MNDWYGDEQATFGDRLATAREAAGLGQQEVASHLGVTERTVRGWENDVSEPRGSRLQKLAGLTGVSLMWLMTGKGDGVPAPRPNEAPPAGDIGAVLGDLRRMRTEMGRMASQVDQIEGRLRRAGQGGR